MVVFIVGIAEIGLEPSAGMLASLVPLVGVVAGARPKQVPLCRPVQTMWMDSCGGNSTFLTSQHA